MLEIAPLPLLQDPIEEDDNNIEIIEEENNEDGGLEFEEPEE